MNATRFLFRQNLPREIRFSAVECIRCYPRLTPSRSTRCLSSQPDPPKKNQVPTKEALYTQIKDRIPSSWEPYLEADRWKSTLSSAKTSTLSLLFSLSKHLNSATGYDKVESRKQGVLDHETRMKSVRKDAQMAKIAYEETIENRRKCQSEINSLLQRKDSWTDIDITRFAELYRKDLSLEQAETAAKLQYKLSTDEFEKAQVDYLSEMRERYVEEQLFSDRIRQASTYWTWGLITTHFLLFIVAQFILEPRKKQSLKRDITSVIEETSDAEREKLEQVLKGLFETRLQLEMAKGNGETAAGSIPQSVVQSSVQETEFLSKPESLMTFGSVSFWQGIAFGTLIGCLSTVTLIFSR